MAARCQFIAGATCPACGQQDKVRRCRDDHREWIECVACGLRRDPNEPERTTHIPTRQE